MKHRSSETTAISHEILSYLNRHPDSQDTLEGIVEWWLLEQKIHREIRNVRSALGMLIDEGLILAEGRGERVRYRINKSRRTDVVRRLKPSSGKEKRRGR